MRNIFEKDINGIKYTFYRIPMTGEIVYNISYVQEGKSEVFIMRRVEGRWNVKEPHLDEFVYNSQPSLEDAIIENETS